MLVRGPGSIRLCTEMNRDTDDTPRLGVQSVVPSSTSREKASRYFDLVSESFICTIQIFALDCTLAWRHAHGAYKKSEVIQTVLAHSCIKIAYSELVKENIVTYWGTLSFPSSSIQSPFALNFGAAIPSSLKWHHDVSCPTPHPAHTSYGDDPLGVDDLPRYSRVAPL